VNLNEEFKFEGDSDDSDDQDKEALDIMRGRSDDDRSRIDDLKSALKMSKSYK
jgi:hypothetical protein